MKKITANEYAKYINKTITGSKFVNKNTDEYIYASLTQPPIKIIDKCGSDDKLDFIVECPNCGSHVNYGKQTRMISGKIYCDIGNCRENLIENDPYLKKKMDL